MELPFAESWKIKMVEPIRKSTREEREKWIEIFASIPFEERIAIIKALKYPDIVIPQRSLDHTEIVKKLNIDVFVVGDDWTGKYDYLKDLGVTVFYFPYGDGLSTTSIKKEIVERYDNIKGKIDNQPNPDIK